MNVFEVISPFLTEETPFTSINLFSNEWSSKYGSPKLDIFAPIECCDRGEPNLYKGRVQGIRRNEVKVTLDGG